MIKLLRLSLGTQHASSSLLLDEEAEELWELTLLLLGTSTPLVLHLRSTFSADEEF